MNEPLHLYSGSNILAGLCSWAGWIEPYLIGRFSCGGAHLVSSLIFLWNMIFRTPVTFSHFTKKTIVKTSCCFINCYSLKLSSLEWPTLTSLECIQCLVVSGKFSCLLIVSENSLDPDQARHSDSSCLTLWCYSRKNILKKIMLKNICRRQKKPSLVTFYCEETAWCCSETATSKKVKLLIMLIGEMHKSLQLVCSLCNIYHMVDYFKPMTLIGWEVIRWEQ